LDSSVEKLTPGACGRVRRTNHDARRPSQTGASV